VGSAVAAGTFYVDGADPGCSDAGPGTAGTPYCSISAAAAARGGPGTTLSIKPAVYREQVTVPASGAPGNPFVFQALGSPVVVDGANDFSAPEKWVATAGDVWLGASVTWSPKQVFADGARLIRSSASPASLPPRSFRYVSGTGLYVNAGGGNPGTHQILVGRRSYGFRLSGRSWVTIDGFTVTRTEDRAIYLSSSSNNSSITRNTVTFANRYGIHVAGSSGVLIGSNVVSDHNDHGITLTSGVTGSTVQDNESFRNARPGSRAANGLDVYGSSGNLIQRNRFHDNQDTGLNIRSSSNDNISLQNLSWNNGDHGFDHLGSKGTLNVGNVAWGNYKDGFSIEGTATGTRLFNSIAVNNGLTTNEFDLWVDADSASGFVSNYNIFWNAASQVPIKYGSTEYATVAAFTAATGYDAQSIQADPRFVDPVAGDFHLRAGSSAIDSANSSVPSWPATDAEGHGREDDPATPNSGVGPVSYADRGALEFLPCAPPLVAALTVTPSSGPPPLDVLADASASCDPDGVLVAYRFDFGDGTVVGPQAGATASHTYAAGTWTASVMVTDDGGASGSAAAAVLVATPNQPPGAALSVNPATGPAPLTVTADGSGSRDPDGSIVSYRFDFGDGTVVGPQAGATASHTYAAGTWTASVMVTDDAAATDSASVVVLAELTETPVDEVHWNITGQTSVTVHWRGSENTIRYGLTTAYGEVGTAQTPSPLPFSSSGPFWEAKLTGLQENTVYHYAIGNGPDHTLRTPPPRGAAGFTVYAEGDIGDTTSYASMGVVQRLIAADMPAFVLALGDLTYGNSHGQAHVDQHFNDVMLWSRDAAYMPAWGNHEWDVPSADDLRNYKGRFDFANGQTSPPTADNTCSGKPQSCAGEDWHWFDYGNVRFIAYPEPWSGAWADWNTRANALMEEAQADPSIKFIVTFGHRPAYSSGHHQGSLTLKGYLDALGASHSKYVLNLNGHSHNYERTYPQNGVVHVTAGTGGASLEQDGTCLWLTCAQPAWSAFRAMHLGPLKLRFTATAIEGSFICGPPGGGVNDVNCAEGSIVDSFTISAVDLPPNGVIDSPLANVTVMAGQSVSFAGTGTDPDGDLPLSFLWDFGGGAGNQTVEDPGPVAFATPGTYTVTFTVTDSLGLADPSPGSLAVTVTPFTQRPTALLTMTPSSGPAPLAVTADASGSSDPDGTIVSYRFDFGDGTVVGPQAGATATHTYGAGAWTASLTVTDDAGATGTVTQVVTVTGNLPPDGAIDTPGGNVTILAGQSVSFSGTGSDPDGPLPLTYRWDFGGGAGLQTVEDPGGVTFATPGTYTVTFTVTDGLGLADPIPASRVVTVDAPPPASPQLLTNGGFEDGQVGWTNWSSTSRYVTTLTPYAGAFALQIDAGSSNRYVYQTIPATPGTSYTVSFALRTTLTTSVGRGRIEWLTSTGSKIESLYFGDTTGTTPWTVQSTTQTAPPGTAQLRIFCYVTADGSGSAWFDAVAGR
jgi:parallel beta-helix repeat protein